MIPELLEHAWKSSVEERATVYVGTVIRSCWSGPLVPAGIRNDPIMRKQWRRYQDIFRECCMYRMEAY